MAKNVFNPGIAQKGLTPPDPPPRGATGNVVLFSAVKRHLSAYYRIKFQLIMIKKINNMIMIMVIILMLVMMTMTKNQTTTMTLWSKYALFKYYYLVKKLPKQLGNARLKMFLAMDAFPNALSC